MVAFTKAGRYQIDSEIGRGSMGIVYKGFDPVIGRSVAIKTIRIEGLSFAEYQEHKARFRREAQAAGALAHPNIVTIHDFGEDQGTLYLAMQLLEGKTLQQMLEEQGALRVETILPIFEQVASALDCAHRHQVIHRDIKPGNIMILADGLVKVTDFGIAKLLLAANMTKTGFVLGSPGYMSPEQIKGFPIDGRSDIFSLAVVLYECLTGMQAFPGQNVSTIIYKVMNEEPVYPSGSNASIHPGLQRVISKALSKHPPDRYETCKDMVQDLKNYRNFDAPAEPSSALDADQRVVGLRSVLPLCPSKATEPGAVPPPAALITGQQFPPVGSGPVIAPPSYLQVIAEREPMPGGPAIPATTPSKPAVGLVAPAEASQPRTGGRFGSEITGATTALMTAQSPFVTLLVPANPPSRPATTESHRGFHKAIGAILLGIAVIVIAATQLPRWLRIGTAGIAQTTAQGTSQATYARENVAISAVEPQPGAQDSPVQQPVELSSPTTSIAPDPVSLPKNVKQEKILKKRNDPPQHVKVPKELSPPACKPNIPQIPSSPSGVPAPPILKLPPKTDWNDFKRLQDPLPYFQVKEKKHRSFMDLIRGSK